MPDTPLDVASADAAPDDVPAEVFSDAPGPADVAGDVAGHLAADVLVLGAGVAGLMAARLLAGQRRVLVLEAADRVGGRIRSHAVPGESQPIELGPEFIHGHATETFALLGESGLLAYDIAERQEDAISGVLVRPADAWEAAEELLDRLRAVDADADVSFDAFLAAHAADVPAAVTRRARSYVEGFNAAYAGQISAHGLWRVEQYDQAHDGQRQYRLIGAYDRLPTALAASIKAPSRVLLQTRVLRVRWQPGRVDVLAERGGRAVRFTAAQAVVALPLGVLQRDPTHDHGVAFEPELPLRAALREKLAMGNVVKAMLLCDAPFWEKEDRDAAFLHSGDAPFPTWWTTLPLRSNLLTGWAGGPAADRLPRGQAAVTRAAIDSVATLFAREPREIAGHVRQCVIADWRDEPLAGGAYSWPRVGGARLPDALAAPIDGTLYFAGEHTVAEMIGTVAGALASGRRAAEQIRV
ncbi:MAG TPA: NAD(P)/FAD-dependent oxidoreductase [Tepidisphaeraceae bacterium]|jgi:monoamine oxidase